jgi:hypothetical protein
MHTEESHKKVGQKFISISSLTFNLFRLNIESNLFRQPSENHQNQCNLLSDGKHLNFYANGFFPESTQRTLKI